MTEAEWLACDDPRPMLEFMLNTEPERQFRLVGAAACRRIWNLMHDSRCQAAVEASEQYADGLISEDTLDHISAAAEEAFEEACSDLAAVHDSGANIAAGVAHAASYASSPSLSPEVLVEALQTITEEAP